MTVYLYIKQHRDTGLKYFGKTVTNPYTYNGSGSYWRRHLLKHGQNILTKEVFGFDNQEMCTEFALKFSKDNNIVHSKNWANLKEETGMDGGYGYLHNEDVRKRIPGRPKGSKDLKKENQIEKIKF